MVVVVVVVVDQLSSYMSQLQEKCELVSTLTGGFFSLPLIAAL